MFCGFFLFVLTKSPRIGGSQIPQQLVPLLQVSVSTDQMCKVLLRLFNQIQVYPVAVLTSPPYPIASSPSSLKTAQTPYSQIGHAPPSLLLCPCCFSPSFHLPKTFVVHLRNLSALRCSPSTVVVK